MSHQFDWERLTNEDRAIAIRYLGDLDRPADLVIAPNDEPYLWRWHLVKSDDACVYFHIQTGSDPERPLHDHPWDNMSVILAGGYEELLQPDPRRDAVQTTTRFPGEVVFRKAAWAHRLLLPANVPYTITQFSTGPKVREWGFWFESGWKSYKVVTEVNDGVSVTRQKYRED